MLQDAGFIQVILHPPTKSCIVLNEKDVQWTKHESNLNIKGSEEWEYLKKWKVEFFLLLTNLSKSKQKQQNPNPNYSYTSVRLGDQFQQLIQKHKVKQNH